MTQEDKELLLKDICARIPNHVKTELHGEVCTVLGYFDDFVMLTSNTPLGQQTNIANIKLYLRPMSSMTEEEKKEYWAFFTTDGHGFPTDDVDKHKIDEYLDWLNAHHFDFRGLIPKGLAIEVTKENNPYKK